MKKLFCILLIAIALFAIGCKKDEATANPDLKTPAGDAQPGADKKTASNVPAPGGASGSVGSGSSQSVNVTPIGGVGAGPMTPVSGTENIQGGGSGAGMVLKQKARGVAGQSPSSVNQMGGEDN